jgi:hypothetical protein
MQTWTEDEIRDLILFAKATKEENEDLRAKIIAMDAMIKNEMAKVKVLQMKLNYLTNNYDY